MYGRRRDEPRRRTGATPAGTEPPAGRSRNKEEVSGREANDVKGTEPHRAVQPEKKGQAGGDWRITAAAAASITLMATLAEVRMTRDPERETIGTFRPPAPQGYNARAGTTEWMRCSINRRPDRTRTKCSG